MNTNPDSIGINEHEVGNSRGDAETRREERVGNWLQTYTGGRFYPFDVREEEIKIEDIAHALSNICRFGGHTKEFYSVAQHSRILSELMGQDMDLYDDDYEGVHPVELERMALLHDSAEAFIGDMVRPLKYSPGMRHFLGVDVTIQEKVFGRFGQSASEVLNATLILKKWDHRLLATEAYQLLDGGPKQWGWDCAPLVIPFIKIEPESPEVAKAKFLKRFDLLYAGTKCQRSA